MISPTPLNLDQISAQAKQAHANVNHLYGGVLPYGDHLEMVARVAVDFLHELRTEDREADEAAVMAAAWFHDVLEDCRWTFSNLVAATSPRVAEIVYALTDELGHTRDERKQRTLPKIAANRLAVFVKICDRIANTGYSRDSRYESKRSSDMYKRYCEEYPAFRAALYRRGEYAGLWSLADRTHGDSDLPLPKPTTVCEALATVPRQVETHGFRFEPHIFYNRENWDETLDVRFCYELVQISDRLLPIQAELGSWFNPFAEGAQQSFLYLVEGIENDTDLVDAILKTRTWLLTNNLISTKDYPNFG